MLALTLTLAAATLVAAAVALRRRRARRPDLVPQLGPMPAGLKHLAASVSDLSDLGVHLSAAHRVASARKPRLGVLLGLR